MASHFSIPQSTQALVELKAKNIKVKGPGQSLEEMALANGVTPMQLYAYIKHLEPKPEPVQADTRYTKEQVKNLFAGTGLGRKKFKFLVAELKLNPQVARQRLKAKGITIGDDQTAKDAAQAANKTPLELVVIMLDAK
jgi:hypothetical protein